MAQTKRKRRSKHRGDATGAVTARGRTSRPLPAQVRKKAAKEAAREERLSRPPSWSRSSKTALLAGAFMFLFLFITNSGQKGSNRLVSALVFAVLAMLIYIPAGYYLERFMYQRRMAKKAAGK